MTRQIKLRKDEVRELAIELALPLDVAERVLAYGKQERRAGYDIALTEVEQGVALPATICARIVAAVQAERSECVCAVEGEELTDPDAPEDEAYNDAIFDAVAAIRSRGPTSALDAVLAQARRETWEKARKIALDPDNCGIGGDATASMIADAIRSAAAGEEGK